MARPIKRITAEPAVVAELERRSRATSIAVRAKERASMVLLRLEGLGVAEVAARLGTTPKRVSTWTKRFETKGLSGLEDEPGRGRKPSVPPEKIERVLTGLSEIPCVGEHPGEKEPPHASTQTTRDPQLGA